MKLKCKGCGAKQKVGFRVWFHYYFNQPSDGPFLHLDCFTDHINDRGGLEF